MSIAHPMFFMILIYLFMFVSLRLLLGEIESVNLSRKEIKKRKKGQSVLEWLTFSRFRDVVPKFFVPIYYITLLVITSGLLVMGFEITMHGESEIAAFTFNCVRTFVFCWWVVLCVVSTDPKCPHLRVELWVPDIKTGKTAKRYKSRAEYEASIVSPEAREGYENWTKNLELISAGGTIENTEGGPIEEEQVKYMIKVSKGNYISTDNPDDEHQYRHIHFETRDGKTGVIKIAEKARLRKAIYNTERNE